MQAAMTGGAPRLYANACGVAITPADVVITLLCNGAPVCVLNLALPTAKGLADDLAIAVTDYERTAEMSVRPLGQVAVSMQRVRNESSHTSESR
jgi:hypothetical protein